MSSLPARSPSSPCSRARRRTSWEASSGRTVREPTAPGRFSTFRPGPSSCAAGAMPLEAVAELEVLRPRELLSDVAALPAALRAWAENDVACRTALGGYLESPAKSSARVGAAVRRRHAARLRAGGERAGSAGRGGGARLCPVDPAQRARPRHRDPPALGERPADARRHDARQPRGPAHAARRRARQLAAHGARPDGHGAGRKAPARLAAAPAARGGRDRGASRRRRRARRRWRRSWPACAARWRASPISSGWRPARLSALSLRARRLRCATRWSAVPALLADLGGLASGLLASAAACDPVPDLAAVLLASLEPEPASNLEDGRVIADGRRPRARSVPFPRCGCASATSWSSRSASASAPASPR